MTGSTSKLVYKPLPEDDPKVRQPDITRARTLLGWEPKVQLEEGLMKTLDYSDEDLIDFARWSSVLDRGPRTELRSRLATDSDLNRL